MEQQLGSGELSSECDSYEFIDGRTDVQGTVVSGLESNAPLRTTSLDSGVQLSPKETFLADRVRKLQQENDELKEAIKKNGDTLKSCVDELNTWKDKQTNSHNSWCEKHELARATVTKLQNENSKLKQEIETMKTCMGENDNSVAIGKNVVCLEEHINQYLTLSDDDRQKLAVPGSTFFQDLTQICKELQNSLKFRSKPSDNPPSFKEDFEKENVKVNRLEENLLQEKQKQSELKKRNNELEKRVDAQQKVIDSFSKGGPMVDINELNEAVQLLGIDMERMERMAAGYVSHGSATPNESFVLSDELQQATDENGFSTDSLILEKENRDLKTENRKLNERIHLLDRRETKLLDDREKAMTEKNVSEKQLKDITERISLLEGKIKEKEEEMDVEIKKKEDVIQELVEKQRQQEMTSKMSEKTNHEIETLKSRIRYFHEEIQAKEKDADDWRMKEFEYQESIRNMELVFGKTKEDLNYSQSALIETRNELSALYHQHEKLLAENQSVRGSSGAEIADYQSRIDNLTAQLLSAEEMVENKDQDYRKLQQDHTNLTNELETIPLLQQQVDLFRRDFDAEKQARNEREDECRQMKEELIRIQAENEKLKEDLNDPTGSRMAELQRRHVNSDDNSWNMLYDQFLAPRGPPIRNTPAPQQSEAELNRQVSGGGCPKCDRMFANLDELQTHVVQCLESDCNSTGVERVCPKCQESFPDLDTLQIHVMECLDD